MQANRYQESVGVLWYLPADTCRLGSLSGSLLALIHMHMQYSSAQLWPQHACSTCVCTTDTCTACRQEFHAWIRPNMRPLALRMVM